MYNKSNRELNKTIGLMQISHLYDANCEDGTDSPSKLGWTDSCGWRRRPSLSDVSFLLLVGDIDDVDNYII